MAAQPGLHVPGPALLADPHLAERAVEELTPAQLAALWRATGDTLVAAGAVPRSRRRPPGWAGEVVALREAVLASLERRRPRQARRLLGVTRATSI